MRQNRACRRRHATGASRRPFEAAPHLSPRTFVQASASSGEKCIPDVKYIPFSDEEGREYSDLVVLDCVHSSAHTLTHHKGHSNVPGVAPSDTTTGASHATFTLLPVRLHHSSSPGTTVAPRQCWQTFLVLTNLRGNSGTAQVWRSTRWRRWIQAQTAAAGRPCAGADTRSLTRRHDTVVGAQAWSSTLCGSRSEAPSLRQLYRHARCAAVMTCVFSVL